MTTVRQSALFPIGKRKGCSGQAAFKDIAVHTGCAAGDAVFIDRPAIVVTHLHTAVALTHNGQVGKPPGLNAPWPDEIDPTEADAGRSLTAAIMVPIGPPPFIQVRWDQPRRGARG